jgi:hypothetical protein
MQPCRGFSQDERNRRGSDGRGRGVGGRVRGNGQSRRWLPAETQTSTGAIRAERGRCGPKRSAVGRRRGERARIAKRRRMELLGIVTVHTTSSTRGSRSSTRCSSSARRWRRSSVGDARVCALRRLLVLSLRCARVPGSRWLTMIPMTARLVVRDSGACRHARPVRFSPPRPRSPPCSSTTQSRPDSVCSWVAKDPGQTSAVIAGGAPAPEPDAALACAGT